MRETRKMLRMPTVTTVPATITVMSMITIMIAITTMLVVSAIDIVLMNASGVYRIGTAGDLLVLVLLLLLLPLLPVVIIVIVIRTVLPVIHHRPTQQALALAQPSVLPPSVSATIAFISIPPHSNASIILALCY